MFCCCYFRELILIQMAKAYLGQCQASTMDCFVKPVRDQRPLMITDRAINMSFKGILLPGTIYSRKTGVTCGINKKGVFQQILDNLKMKSPKTPHKFKVFGK